MEGFKFKFKTVAVKEPKPKTTKKRVKTSSKKVTRDKIFIIERNYECTIVTSDSNDKFGIVDNDGNFVPLDVTCYDCTGKSTLYRKVNNSYFTFLRLKSEYLPKMPDSYLPFKPGLKVKGNIIIRNTTFKTFIIKKIIK